MGLSSASLMWLLVEREASTCSVSLSTLCRQPGPISAVVDDQGGAYGNEYNARQSVMEPPAHHPAPPALSINPDHGVSVPPRTTEGPAKGAFCRGRAPSDGE